MIETMLKWETFTNAYGDTVHRADTDRGAFYAQWTPDHTWRLVPPPTIARDPITGLSSIDQAKAIAEALA